MFGFGKKATALYGENYRHIADRDDWDAMNRELYAKVIEGWPSNGLAAITNSHGGQRGLPIPFLRIPAGLDPKIRAVFSGFRNKHFDKIFRLAGKRSPHFADCYQVKRLGLPDNSLVYLVEHRNGEDRTILVFGGERLRGKLEERLASVSEIVANSGRGAQAAPEPAPAKAETADGDGEWARQPLPAKKLVAKAHDAHLEAREAWLEARIGELNYKQRVELTHIQGELKRRAHVR